MSTTLGTSPFPGVFDAGLPTIDYETALNPDEVHAIVRRAGSRRRLPSGRTGLSY